MNSDQLQLHLPKHLSADSKNALLDALKEFPKFDTGKFYTNMLSGNNHIFQGDGLRDFIVVNIQAKEFKNASVMVLSNTCDISPDNERPFNSNIVYAPIINFAKYLGWLEAKEVDPQKIKSHKESIVNQGCTQIMFLPEQQEVIEDSIVFFDRISHVGVEYLSTADVPSRRIFTLSDYGHYLFLFKLSFHFCRFQDKVDRGDGVLN